MNKSPYARCFTPRLKGFSEGSTLWSNHPRPPRTARRTHETLNRVRRRPAVRPDPDTRFAADMVRDPLRNFGRGRAAHRRARIAGGTDSVARAAGLASTARRDRA